MTKGGSRSGAGRPRKPTALKVLEGTTRADRDNSAEPKFDVGSGTVPDWLDEYGRELWASVVPQMLTAGVLTVVDVPLLAMACERYSLYRRAAARVKKAITQKSGANGKVVMPEVAVSKGAMQDVMAVLREFGAGASSRSRIKVPEAGADIDPFEEFMKMRARKQQS